MNHNTGKFEGGCLCGAVRYQALGQPIYASHCHCPTCRKVSGAAVVQWLTFHLSNFAFTQGQPTHFASSASVQRGFCAQCGTPLTYQIEADYIDITLCSLDNPQQIAPEFHTWTEFQMPWIKLGDGLPQYPQSRE